METNDAKCAKIQDPREEETQVVSQTRRLIAELNTLEILVGDTRNRFENVLRESAPEPEDPCSERIEETVVPFAHDIRVQRRRVFNCNELIRDLLERAEL